MGTDDVVRPFLQPHAGDDTAPTVFPTAVVEIMVVEVDRWGFVGDQNLLRQPPLQNSRRTGIFIVGGRVLGQFPVMLQADKVVFVTLVKLLLHLGGNNVVGGTDNVGEVLDLTLIVVHPPEGINLSHNSLFLT